MIFRNPVSRVISPLTQNLPVHLPLVRIVPLDCQDHSIAHLEIGILVLVGVAAHTDGPVGQIAEHTAAILPGDDGLPPAAYRMAEFRALEELDSVSLTETRSAPVAAS